MENTRQLLKIFGVAMTNFEAEAEKLQVVAAQFSSDTGKDEIANQLKNSHPTVPRDQHQMARNHRPCIRSAERTARSVC